MREGPAQWQRCVRVALVAAFVAATALVASPLPGQDTAPPAPIRFRDVTREAGVEFRQHTGGYGRRHLPETSGSGAGWLDYDADGRWDLYLVDSGPLPGRDAAPVPPGERPPGTNAMFRNRGDGGFALAPGVAADAGHGRGVSFADYDNDGFIDVFVGNWGPDALYRNNGDGTFTDVTEVTSVGDERLASSSAWADLDADGWLDLYVVTYVAYEPETAPACGDPAAGLIDFCHPALFEGQADMVFQNLGDGGFADRSSSLADAIPADGKGLAVALEDLDDDGRPDVYVANDTTPNYVHFNRGGFRFEERGMLSGLGMGESGQTQAGMGIAIGDIDGDLVFDIGVTNFEFENYNLYRRVAPGFYADDSGVVGINAATVPPLGFGIVMADFDLDGDLDLAAANGHILELADDYPQPNQVFSNQLTALRDEAVADGLLVAPAAGQNGRAPDPTVWRPEGPLFIDSSGQAGVAITRRRVSRGLSVGDADGDGLPDLLVTNVNDTAELLRNVAVDPGSALVLRLRDINGNRDAIGADVRVTPCEHRAACRSAAGTGADAAGYPQRFRVRGASSYASQSSTDLHVGLGAAGGAQVEVRWPDGAVERLDYVVGGRALLIVRGRGIVASRALGVGVDRSKATSVQNRLGTALFDERLDMSD